MGMIGPVFRVFTHTRSLRLSFRPPPPPPPGNFHLTIEDRHEREKTGDLEAMAAGGGCGNQK